MTDISICTVSYNSATYLRLNRRLTSALNPTVRTQWVVAENSPIASLDALRVDEEGFSVIAGVEQGHAPNYHHTIALTNCLRLVKTRFVVVIDPDLFVVRKNWVQDIIQWMIDRDLAILGVPWHPRNNSKYRYFPAVHFSVFDTSVLPNHRIDFLPDYPDGDVDPHWPHGWSKDRDFFAVTRIAALLAWFPAFRFRRRYYTDTGSRLFKRFVHDTQIKREVMEPVFDREAELSKLSSAGAVLQNLLPDELCYVPKGYTSTPSFLEELVDIDTPSWWEQFRWQGAPFCFHVRRNLDKTIRNWAKDVEIASLAVEKLLVSANR